MRRCGTEDHFLVTVSQVSRTRRCIPQSRAPVCVPKTLFKPNRTSESNTLAAFRRHTVHRLFMLCCHKSFASPRTRPAQAASAVCAVRHRSLKVASVLLWRVKIRQLVRRLAFPDRAEEQSSAEEVALASIIFAGLTRNRGVASRVPRRITIISQDSGSTS